MKSPRNVSAGRQVPRYPQRGRRRRREGRRQQAHRRHRLRRGELALCTTMARPKSQHDRLRRTAHRHAGVA